MISIKSGKTSFFSTFLFTSLVYVVWNFFNEFELGIKFFVFEILTVWKMYFLILFGNFEANNLSIKENYFYKFVLELNFATIKGSALSSCYNHFTLVPNFIANTLSPIE